MTKNERWFVLENFSSYKSSHQNGSFFCRKLHPDFHVQANCCTLRTTVLSANQYQFFYILMLLTMWEESVWECCEVSENDETGARHVSSGLPPFTSHHPAPRLPVRGKRLWLLHLLCSQTEDMYMGHGSAHASPTSSLFIVFISISKL